MFVFSSKGKILGFSSFPKKVYQNTGCHLVCLDHVSSWYGHQKLTKVVSERYKKVRYVSYKLWPFPWDASGVSSTNFGVEQIRTPPRSKQEAGKTIDPF